MKTLEIFVGEGGRRACTRARRENLWKPSCDRQPWGSSQKDLRCKEDAHNIVKGEEMSSTRIFYPDSNIYCCFMGISGLVMQTTLELGPGDLGREMSSGSGSLASGGPKQSRAGGTEFTGFHGMSIPRLAVKTSNTKPPEPRASLCAGSSLGVAVQGLVREKPGAAHEEPRVSTVHGMACSQAAVGEDFGLLAKGF